MKLANRIGRIYVSAIQYISHICAFHIENRAVFDIRWGMRNKKLRMAFQITYDLNSDQVETKEKEAYCDRRCDLHFKLRNNAIVFLSANFNVTLSLPN